MKKRWPLAHTLKMAGMIGLTGGVFIFALLLYLSDFGTKLPPREAVSPAPATETAAAMPANPTDSALQKGVQWIFGPPEQAPVDAPPTQ